ncbi:MAG: aspartate aminotransferase family protein [Actinobacteria bacterium]|nr:aspartate aminotransferase family protein [Actinomycetota bacterium]
MGEGAGRSVRDKARAHLGKHFTRATAWRSPELLVIERGEGCYLWDDHGRRYLDGLAGLFCVNIGHGRADIAEAAADQMRRLSFATNWAAAHPPAAEAAALIAGLAPEGLDVVFFVNSGSEANESAIKFAREYHQANGEPQRTKVLSRRMAYHGTTLGALSATGIPQFRAPFQPLLPWFRHVPNTLGWEREDEVAAGQAPCIKAIEEAILEEGPETIAMLIAEPVQNVGGVLVPPDGYWTELRHLCDTYGILLCADEVICGFGRLGHWFGSLRVGARPDLITFAKGVTSAYAPLGGMIVRGELMDRLLDTTGMFTHGVTWGGHPLCTAVAVANITALRDEDVLGNVLTLEPHLRQGLGELAARHRIVKEVRGAGYFWGIEIMGDRETGRELDPEEKAAVCRELLPRLLKQNGLMTRADDRGPAMLMLSPPLVADKTVLDDLLERVDATLTGAEAEISGGGP